MRYKFYIIDNLEYLEVWEDGECVNTLTQPFCENVLKLVNDDGMLSRSALGLYARNIFLHWAGEQELDGKVLNLSVPVLQIELKKYQDRIIEVLCPEHFNEILFYEIIKAIICFGNAPRLFGGDLSAISAPHTTKTMRDSQKRLTKNFVKLLTNLEISVIIQKVSGC